MDSAVVMTDPPGRPACLQPCDTDCEAGPMHCYWIHEPNHKPGWHSRDDCPVTVQS